MPLLTLLTDLKDEDIFSSSVAIILPVTVISLFVTGLNKQIPWNDALPYLIGSAVGGIAAGLWGERIPTKWLHKVLGLLIIWGGIRTLC